jgi:hypothetical protein
VLGAPLLASVLVGAGAATGCLVGWSGWTVGLLDGCPSKAICQWAEPYVGKGASHRLPRVCGPSRARPGGSGAAVYRPTAGDA